MVEKSDSITDEDIVETVVAAADGGVPGQARHGRARAVHAVHAHGAAADLDQHWREHLAALDYLRQGIHLRGYAQKNPKQEYKREAFELFSQLIDTVKTEVTKVLLTVRVQTQEQVRAGRRGHRAERRAGRQRAVHASERGRQRQRGVRAAEHRGAGSPPRRCPRVGRNDPCPCGSGKRFKECHGKLA